MQVPEQPHMPCMCVCVCVCVCVSVCLFVGVCFLFKTSSAGTDSDLMQIHLHTGALESPSHRHKITTENMLLHNHVGFLLFLSTLTLGSLLLCTQKTYLHFSASQCNFNQYWCIRRWLHGIQIPKQFFFKSS